MDFSLTDFTPPQRQALLDLLVLGMYADGHLTSAEEARVQSVLNAMNLESDYDRQREFDAAVTRVRQHAESFEKALACATQLAQHFETPGQREKVMRLLNDLLASDRQVTPTENRFLSIVADVFRA